MSESHANREQLSRLIDGDLALAERAAVLDHVAHCPVCAAEQARLVEVSAALRTIPPEIWSEVHTASVLSRLASSSPLERHAVERRRAGRAVAVSLVIVTLIGVAGLVVAVPIGPLVAGAIWQAFAWLPPLGATSALGVGVALLAISLIAPLVAYPLARWR